MYLLPSVSRLSLLALALSPSFLCAADWPRWGGRDDCNMISDERGLPATFTPGKKYPDGSGIDLSTTENVKWVARLGGQTYGTPTVANGRVYVGTNDDALQDRRVSSDPRRPGNVPRRGHRQAPLAVDRAPLSDQPARSSTSTTWAWASAPRRRLTATASIWSRTAARSFASSARGLAGGNHGPFVDEGRFIAGPGRPPVPLTATDADILWKVDCIHDLDIWCQDAANCSVLVHGDFVYVCTSNGVDRSHIRVPRPLAPSLIVLNKYTGRLAAVDDERIGTRLFHGQWSSPSLGTVDGRPLVFFGGGDGVLYAFQPLTAMPPQPVKLKKVWSFDCNPPEYKVVKRAESRLFRWRHPQAPRQQQRRHVHRPQRNHRHAGLLQEPRLRDHRAGPFARPRRGHVDLHRRHEDRRRDRARPKSGPTRSAAASPSPSIAAGLLYIADTFEGIYCFDAETGKRYWFHPSGARDLGFDDGGRRQGLRRHEKGPAGYGRGKGGQAAGENLAGTPAYCTPVVANGVLFVTTH